ncbi:helix-turn-helix domain-containing protein [Mesorhizobium sp. M1406]|uniref:helix-turn-helix domain-containing protein n=1 Tax=Mesorhizobium sp. M1406 TaxID=2957099 RepID=UPI0033353856
MNDVFKEVAALVDNFDRRLKRIENDIARLLEIIEQMKKPAPDLREPEKLTYRLSDVTEITGISRSMLYKLFSEGKLHASKSGRRTLILATELERYLREVS